MTKILIVGSTGLLGSRLVPFLRERGHQVITHGNRHKANVQFNLSSRSEAYACLQEIRPEIIINLASLTSVELCEENVNYAYLTNTYTVENLAFWIGDSGANCHLVQISTDHVYDGLGPHLEGAVNLTNVYAFSKYAAEIAASRVSSTILRTNFVGRSLVGHRESLTDWLYAAMKKGETLQVLSDVYFSPLSIAKLVEMIELAVDLRVGGVYNLGSLNGMSKADFDFAFAEFLKLPTLTMSRIKSSEASFLKAYRPKDMRMDVSKFERTFNVKLPSLIDLIPDIASEYL